MHYGSQIAVVKINFDYRRRGLLQSSHFYIQPCLVYRGVFLITY
jgi:hypothetical protein